MYCRAAKQGYAEAEHKLGTHYAEGWGVPRNSVLAYVWLSLAGAGAYADRSEVVKHMSETQIESAAPPGMETDFSIGARRLPRPSGIQPRLARVTSVSGTWQPMEALSAAQGTLHALGCGAGHTVTLLTFPASRLSTQPDRGWGG